MPGDTPESPLPLEQAASAEAGAPDGNASPTGAKSRHAPAFSDDATEGRDADAAPAPAVLRCAPAGDLLSANEPLLSLLGFGSESDLREAAPRIQDLYGDHEDRVGLGLPLAESLPTEEVRWIRRDGVSIWVRIRVGPDSEAGDDAVEDAFDVRVEDVTGRRHLEKQLRHAQKMEALGQLAGGMANDLNSLLTAALAHVDLLEKALREGDTIRAQDDVREVRRAATTSAQMVKHLLSYSRGERLKLQAVSLAEVVRNSMRLVRPLLPEDVALHSMATEVGPVLADATAVEKTLLALAARARDAMPDGGHLEIRVGEGGFDQEHLVQRGWGDPGDYGVVTVTDTGVGMAPETVARLFQPFFAETSSRPAASGLSMSMVYGIMKQHRGFIEVESEPGRGTTVRLYFQLLEARASIGAEQPESLAGGEVILFVEDDDSLRQVTCRILRSQGYRVLEASDGLEALEVIRREGRPDLLVTDLVMPSMTGLELVERVSSEPDPPPVLLTSGFRPEFLLGWKGDPAAYAFLEKPWQIETLLGEVRAVLDRETAAGS